MTLKEALGGLLVALVILAGALGAASWYGKLVMGIAALAAVLWFARGHRIKGWIGPTLQELRDEEARLDALAARWEKPDGTPLDQKERLQVLARRERIYGMLRQHPENPRNR